jgi:hypothetical protein
MTATTIAATTAKAKIATVTKESLKWTSPLSWLRESFAGLAGGESRSVSSGWSAG